MLINLTENIKYLSELNDVNIISILHNNVLIDTILVEDFNKYFTIVKSAELTLGVLVVLEYVTKEINLIKTSGISTDVSYILYNDEITSYKSKNNYVLDLSYYNDTLIEEEVIKGINIKTLGDLNKEDRYYIVKSKPYIETPLKLKYNRSKALLLQLESIKNSIINDDFYTNYASEYLNNEVFKTHEKLNEISKNAIEELTDFNNIDYSEFTIVNDCLIKNNTYTIFIDKECYLICLIGNIIYTNLDIDKETLLLNHINSLLHLLDNNVKNNISSDLFNKLFNNNNILQSKVIQEYTNNNESDLLAIETLLKQSNVASNSSLLNTLEQSLIDKYKEIDELQSKLTLVHKSINRITKEKEYIIDSIRKKEVEDYKIKAIVNHPHFNGIYTSYDKKNIAIKLKDMYFVYNDVKFKLPEDLYIYITNNDILIGCNPNQLIVGFSEASIPTPHAITPKHKVDLIRLTDNFEESGIKLFACCWGETYANEIIKLAINKDYLDILEYIVVWLKQVNVADSAGKRYSNWSQMK